MAGFHVECLSARFTVITILDVRILTVTEFFPDPHTMTLDSLVDSLTAPLLATVDLVLVSDARSFFVGEQLTHSACFRGLLLCTEPVYRLGRLLIREVAQLLGGKCEPAPLALSVVALNFAEPFALGEICVTAHANGCGPGGANWAVTKGVDPELVRFTAFVVSGFCEPTLPLFPAPSAPPRIDAACVLPSALQAWDFVERLEELARAVAAALAERKKVIVPAFVDDSLYTILYFLRVRKAMSARFWVASFAYDQLMDIMTNVCGTEGVIAISSAQALALEQPRLADLALAGSVIFAPYPVGQPEFGQIMALKQKHVDALTHVQPICGAGPDAIPLGTASSGPAKLARFVQELKAKTVFGPPDFALDRRQPYPARVALADSLVRWVDLRAVDRMTRRFENLRVVCGALEGERAVLEPGGRHCVMNPPTPEELAIGLRQDGATGLRWDGRTLSCRFRFVPGDDQRAEIEFGDVITVTTGSARIESAILGLIGVPL